MNKDTVVNLRKATKSDIDFLSRILVSAAEASGVNISVADLATNPDTYQYIEGFPNATDIGIVAETDESVLVGAIWVRLLPNAVHAINEPLPELTIGVIPEYQHMGIGKRLLEEIYKAVLSIGIPKISLGVHKDNIPAINLYRQQNWIEDGYYHQYIMMSKEIDK